MKRKLAVLAIASLMTATLAACGGTTGTKDAATESTAASTETAAGTTEAAASTEEEAITTTITVWSPAEDQSADQGNWLATMCDQFSKQHPNWNITFEYGVCAEGDAKTNVTQDVEAAADVYMFANDNISDLVSAGALSKLGGSALESVKATNTQEIIDSVTLDGAVYGIPFTTNTWYMYYDNSKFTTDDIKSLDTMLTKGKVAFPLSNSWYLASFYVANGGTLFGANGTDEAAGIDFGGDKGTAVTKYLVDMVKNPNFINDADGAGIAGLRDGSVNAIFSGSWDAAAVKEALGDKMGAAALPSVTIDGTAAQLKSFAGSKAIGVNPNYEYQQVAIALAQYLAGSEAQEAHYNLRSVVPCNTELLKDATIAADPVVVAQNDTFNKTSIIQPFVAAMGQYWSPAENMGKAILNGEVTADNAADKTTEFNTAMNTSAVQ